MQMVSALAQQAQTFTELECRFHLIWQRMQITPTLAPDAKCSKVHLHNVGCQPRVECDHKRKSVSNMIHTQSYLELNAELQDHLQKTAGKLNGGKTG